MDQLISPAAVLFWLALGLLVYVYLGYPLIAWLRQAAVPAARRTRADRAACDGHRGGAQRRTSYQPPHREPAGLRLSPRPSCRHRRQRWFDR